MNNKSDFEVFGGTYRQVGDYLIPNLELPAEKKICAYRCMGVRVSGGDLCAAKAPIEPAGDLLDWRFYWSFTACTYIEHIKPVVPVT